jgi:hypothetical protein
MKIITKYYYGIFFSTIFKIIYLTSRVQKNLLFMQIS